MLFICRALWGCTYVCVVLLVWNVYRIHACRLQLLPRKHTHSALTPLANSQQAQQQPLTRTSSTALGCAFFTEAQ